MRTPDNIVSTQHHPIRSITRNRHAWAVWPAVVLMLAVFCRMPAQAEAPADVIESLQTGSINWTTGTVSAIGTSSPASGQDASEGSQELILHEARTKAYARLDLTLRHVRVTSRRQVLDLLNEERQIADHLLALTGSAEIVHQRYLSDGTVAVEVAMNLYGGAAQLLLPEEIQQVQPIMSVSSTAPDDQTAPAPPRDEGIAAVPPPFTGLVLDARKLRARPAMTVKVKDESGRVVYGPAFISREFAVQRGMSGFTVSAQPEHWGDRVGSQPLVCRVLKTLGEEQADYVVSNTDAAKLRSAVSHMGFLRQCRVLVIMDPF